MNKQWTFFSNHAHVLFCLYTDPTKTMREVADSVGITERAVQRIVADLERERIVRRIKNGRNNIYSFSLDKSLRHDLEAHKTVKDLIDLVGDGPQ